MSYPYIAFAPRVTQLTSGGTLAGSYIVHGFSFTNKGAAAIITVSVTTSAGVNVIPIFTIFQSTTLNIECPFIVNNGLIFTVNSGTTADGLFTIYHSNIGA